MKKSDIIRSTCPYCGVGCQIDMHIMNDLVINIDAPYNIAPNYGRLCVKGRYGIDFIHHPSRLTSPLIRKDLGAKPRRPGDISAFREASWDEALDLAAQRLAETKQRYGSESIGTFCSAKATNEDNYVFQKFVRAVLGTNNIDHCARLCHAASVAGLQIAIGSSAMSNSIAEMKNLEVFIVTGSNTTETHPVISTFLRQAVIKNKAKLIVVDPRRIGMVDFATLWLSQKPGTDVAVFQAMAHVIIDENLYNKSFIENRTEGFDTYAKSVQECTPEWAERISSVPAESIRQAARLYATANSAAIYWGMGISQSVHGTNNTLSLANLALLTGHIGKPGSGLNPLRGQNNVQGCSDSGGLPNVFPGYQPVDDPKVRAKFEQSWGRSLNPEPGLTTMEMADAVNNGNIHAYYIMGENPMMSEPDLNHARKVFQKLDLIIVQDIFFNETAAYADIILPAASFAEKDGTFTNSDRRVQRIRKAIAPPGSAKADWEIICQLAQRTEELLGSNQRGGFQYRHPSEIWDEMASLTPPFQGISYKRIEIENGVHWPCPSPDHPGTPYLFSESFPLGRGRFTPIEYTPSAELPNEEYPLILSTGRVLYHWHGGTLTRRSHIEAIYPELFVEIHPKDAAKYQILDNNMVRVRSRRGEIKARAKITRRSPPGVVFVPFHFAEAAANELTKDARDPLAKIPDYKVCAVAISSAAS